jgi:hypothetical protein
MNRRYLADTEIVNSVYAALLSELGEDNVELELGDNGAWWSRTIDRPAFIWIRVADEEWDGIDTGTSVELLEGVVNKCRQFIND